MGELDNLLALGAMPFASTRSGENARFSGGVASGTP